MKLYREIESLVHILESYYKGCIDIYKMAEDFTYEISQSL